LSRAEMDYWKSKVLPKMKLIFVKTGSKKAAEVVKAFDESKVGTVHAAIYMDASRLKREYALLFVVHDAGGDQRRVRGEEGGSPA
jgi:hypothetical protein